MNRKKIVKTALLTGAAAVGGWMFLRFLGPVFLPFAVGLTAALLAEPLVALLQNRLHLPRWLAAGLGIAALYTAAGVLLYGLCRVLCREAAGFLRTLPQVAASVETAARAVESWLLRMSERFPDGVGLALREGVRSFFQNGAGLTARGYEWVFSAVTSLLKRLPDLTLFLLTAALSGFMLASQLPALRQLWQRKAPPKWKSCGEKAVVRLKRTLGGWLRAQVKLMLLSALVLAGGFLILGVAYPILFAVGIALIDALPVLGSGMVLIPWGMLCFLQGDTVLGVGLCCLYGVASLVRTALEPRLLGKQIGLDPLLTLLALYAGYQLAGVGGMLLFPVGAILVKQFWDFREKEIDN